MEMFRTPDLKLVSASERFQEAIIRKIRALENETPENKALFVECLTYDGASVRVVRLQFTESMVVVVHGFDAKGNPTYVMSSADALQIVCRLLPKQGVEKKREPIGFEVPKPRSDK
jgi:hypothetical protein